MILKLASPVWASEETKGVSAQDQKLESKPVATSSDQTREVQEALRVKAQHAGAVNGKTQAALDAFQQANGLRVSRVKRQSARKVAVEKRKMLASQETKEETK
jgi:hypothetical protein